MRGSGELEEKWECECGFSRHYGIPCQHELKVIVLTQRIIKQAMDCCYLDEDYYDKRLTDISKDSFMSLISNGGKKANSSTEMTH